MKQKLNRSPRRKGLRELRGRKRLQRNQRNNMKDKLIIAGVVLALVLGGFGLKNDPATEIRTEIIKEVLGAAAGPDHYVRQHFLEGFETGGVGASSASTTVGVSTVVNAKEWRDVDYIEYTPTVGAITLTSVASTSFDGILSRERGAKHTITVYNATTTTGAPSVITWAGATGVILQEDEGETTTQNGLEVGRITFVRKADSDILMWYEAAGKQ